jgi:hypothetical protein
MTGWRLYGRIGSEQYGFRKTPTTAGKPKVLLLSAFSLNSSKRWQQRFVDWTIWNAAHRFNDRAMRFMHARFVPLTLGSCEMSEKNRE